MEFRLSSELQEFVDLEVASGRFDSADEVIEAALMQMRERTLRLQQVRQRIMESDVDQMLQATA